MADREAAQVAKRRARDEAAAEMDRQKAKDAMEKQQKLARAAAAIVVPKSAVAPPVVPAVAEPAATKATSASEMRKSAFSIFGGAKPAEK